MYGEGLAEVLPSTIDSLDRAVEILGLLALVAAIWTGYRGGPFLLNRAAVLHEIGSPLSLRRMLLPRLVRQAAAISALGAISVTTMLAMSSQDGFGLMAAVRLSAVAMALLLTAVAQAAVWLVVWRAEGMERRWLPAMVNVALALALLATHLLDVGLGSGVGFAILLVAGVVSWACAILFIDSVPISHLWQRASALEDMRSAMVSFDFQQVLVNLRRASDQTRRGKNRKLAKTWMPVQFWRYLAGAQHGLESRLMGIAAATVAFAVLIVVADPSDGIVLLAVAGAGFIVGSEFSGPISSTAGQVVFLVHYPKGSASVLRGQLLTAVVLAVAVGGLGVFWFALDGPPDQTYALLGLFSFGTLAAAVQGRLGSPDLAGMALKLGPAGLGPALWMRALLGPILVLALTILVSHGWLRPGDLDLPWLSYSLTLAVMAAVLATFPLERYGR